MVEIIPAIIPKSFREIEEKTALVAGLVETVQIDVCDGKFTPNKTWPFITRSQSPFEELIAEKKGLPLGERLDYEFDLMVAKPAEAVPDFVRAGASRVILHLESAEPDTLSDLIAEWKHSVEIGLALKPSTPIENLEAFLHEVAFVQCMGNDRIGFSGISLDERSVLPKISALRKRHPRLVIGVDIGVSIDTAPRLIAVGANRLVVGSAIFESEDPRFAIEQFKRLG